MRKISMTIFGVIIGIILWYFLFTRMFQGQPIYGWIWAILGIGGLVWWVTGFIQKTRNRPAKDNPVDK